MNFLTNFFINKLHIENIYLINIIYTFIIFLILKIIFKIFSFINNKVSNDEKQIYIANKRNKTIFSISFLLAFFIIWRNELKDFITIISFISAALTLAIRDIIYNYFCGIYIKVKKPIKIEDRIKIKDITGDVINLNALNFEILEVDNNTNQSTGKVIHIPNTNILSEITINYNTAFKYIWDEINININIKSDTIKAKEILLNIIEENEVIKDIPKKMQREIKKSNSDYRIYFNKLTPIVYLKINENKITLTARFLIHPKKQRNIENDIYEKLISEYKKNNIELV